jgi:acetyltransferase-like isoleucine patch superfamily enzyme
MRLLGLALTALMPNVVKLWLYRHVFGYEIGADVTIGLSLLDAESCSIGAGTVIGHGNAVYRVKRLELGDHVRFGHLNVVRGGDEVVLGRYCELLRMNELNAIPDPDVVAPVDSRLLVGPGSVITTGHKIDFTDRVTIGRRTIIGGRNSSLWTHNRQRTAPIEVGDLAYIGSEIRMSPGSGVPNECVVGMGSVITDVLEGDGQLFAGVPARAVKALSDDDRFLVERKTRDDLPDDL